MSNLKEQLETVEKDLNNGKYAEALLNLSAAENDAYGHDSQVGLKARMYIRKAKAELKLSINARFREDESEAQGALMLVSHNLGLAFDNLEKN